MRDCSVHALLRDLPQVGKGWQEGAETRFAITLVEMGFKYRTVCRIGRLLCLVPLF